MQELPLYRISPFERLHSKERLTQMNASVNTIVLYIQFERWESGSSTPSWQLSWTPSWTCIIIYTLKMNNQQRRKNYIEELEPTSTHCQTNI